MDALAATFKQCDITTVSLYVPQGISVLSVEEQLGTATNIKVEAPIISKEIPWITARTHDVVVLDLVINMTDDIKLDWFRSCTRLKHLSLKVQDVRPFNAVYGFEESSQKPPLESLTITKANFVYGFFRSLQGLPLKSLSFVDACSRITDTFNNLVTLIEGTSLEQLDISRSPWGGKKELRKIQQKFPKLSFKPEPPPAPALRENFFGILTNKKDLEHCYPLATLNQGSRDLGKLAQFLSEVGGDEDQNWTIVDRYSCVYTHNVCQGLAGASPIACPDRMRIAAEEPRNTEQILAFWKYARKVPLIVKVKTRDAFVTPYYPLNGGEVKEFGTEQHKIAVKCIALSKHDVHPITKRTLQLDNDIVHHIQVDWTDGYGLDINILSVLIEMACEIEKQHEGDTLVHCTLGLGRTGTFIACQIIRSLVNACTDPQELLEWSLNLEELLRTLRQKRSSMIQHEDQLECILVYTALIVKAQLAELNKK